jgi:hypothetical protein
MPMEMKTKKKMIPPTTLAMAWNGGIRGDPKNPLYTVQSKEMGISPYPVTPPKILLTMTFLGAIQHTQVNMERLRKIQPGNQ